MPEHDGPRDGTRTGGLGDEGDLAARVEEMERQLLRTQSRQRALIHVLARMSMSYSEEMERLSVD